MAETPRTITIDVTTHPSVRAALAAAWEQGRRTGHSRAMRKMSDEPLLNLDDVTNPFESQSGGWCAPTDTFYDALNHPEGTD